MNEDLEAIDGLCAKIIEQRDRIEALEAALREAFTQPAAWRVDGIREGAEHVWVYWKPEWPTMHAKEGDKVTPLYAAPAPEQDK
jgi:hypothetical protein